MMMISLTSSSSLRHALGRIVLLCLAAQTALSFAPSKPMLKSVRSSSSSFAKTQSRSSTSSVTRLAFFSKETTPDQVQDKTATESNESWLNSLSSSWGSTFFTNDNKSPQQALQQSSASNGVLQVLQTVGKPVQDVLDDASDGWVMSYADLRPESSQTVAGQAFLASNFCYLLAGIVLQFVVGDVVLGVATEVCALASFQYHYQQLHADGSTNSSAVRIALLLDYVFALLAIGLGAIDLLSTAPLFLFNSQMPLEQLITAVSVAGVGVACLALGWKYEHGKPYMVWHSLWHVASAYAGFLIGDLHHTVAAITAAGTGTMV